jgi:hypothetical protein
MLKLMCMSSIQRKWGEADTVYRIETPSLHIDRDPSTGRKMINQYLVRLSLPLRSSKRKCKELTGRYFRR